MLHICVLYVCLEGVLSFLFFPSFCRLLHLIAGAPIEIRRKLADWQVTPRIKNSVLCMFVALIEIGQYLPAVSFLKLAISIIFSRKADCDMSVGAEVSAAN